MKIIFLIIGCIGFCGTLSAQDAPSLALKYYNAIGGEYAEKNIKSILINKITYMMGMEIKIYEMAVFNDKAISSAYIKDVKTRTDVLNHDSSWTQTYSSPEVRELEEEPRKQL